MKIHLEEVKSKRQISLKKSGFIDSGFVKTCDELVIGVQINTNVKPGWSCPWTLPHRQSRCQSQSCLQFTYI